MTEKTEITIKTESGRVKLRPISLIDCDEYMAGSDGKIYSRRKRNGYEDDGNSWHLLSGYINNKGYNAVRLWIGKRPINAFVHRLVCSAFHGPPSNPSLVTRHLDRNPLNNLPSNLAWGTIKDNWEDRRVHKTVIAGESHYLSKFTNEERKHICWAIEHGLCSQRQAARALGIAQSTLWAIIKQQNFAKKGVMNAEEMSRFRANS